MGSGHRADAIATSHDTKQTQKQKNYGDKGYILLWGKFHW